MRRPNTPLVKRFSSLELAQFLGVIKAEAKRWLGKGLIPVCEQKPSGLVFDVAILEGLRSQVRRWRVEELTQKNLQNDAIAQMLSSISSAVKVLAPQQVIVAPIEIAFPLGIHFQMPVRIPFAELVDSDELNGYVALTDAERSELAARIGNEITRRMSELRAHLEKDVAAWRRSFHEFMVQNGFSLSAVVAEQDVEIAVLQKHLQSLLKDKVETLVRASGQSSGQGINIKTLDAWVKRCLQQSLPATLADWAQHHYLERQRERTGLKAYADLFPEARSGKRELVFHMGPTNSGKTHAALELLAAARNGMYLAPLRLMALENFERLNEQGVATDLVTGEEIRRVAGAQHTASTIEMADTTQKVEVAVIDEIQMISDKGRGWAWTQALIGIAADEVIMTGSAEALPFIQKAAAITGDRLTVRRFERKTSLAVLPSSVTLRDMRQGDAVIAFSRRAVLEFREVLLQMGKSVATIYGDLGPEVRSQQASRFRSGEAQILIATDAVGMGLNLPIKRIFFSEGSKFDGSEKRPISPSEIRQIAGRAGRFGLADDGLVGVLHDASDFIPIISAALAESTHGTTEPKLSIMPPWRAVEQTAHLLQSENLGQILRHICTTLLSEMPDFRAPDMSGLLPIAEQIDASLLPFKTRFAYLGCPINTDNEIALLNLREWARSHGNAAPVTSEQLLSSLPPFAQSVLLSKEPSKGAANGEILSQCERAVKEINVYMWLAMKWPEAFPSLERAREMRETLNLAIENILTHKVIG